MAQLALFEGSHLPRTAAREALSQGDLVEAHAQLERILASPEFVTGTKLGELLSYVVAQRLNGLPQTPNRKPPRTH